MSQEIQSEETLDQAWRNVELILKIQSISRDFAEESKPQIETQLKERYESAFTEAREHGKSEQEAHMLAMGGLDNEVLLKREFNGQFLTEQEGAFGRFPETFCYVIWVQAHVSAGISLGLFWRELQSGAGRPGIGATIFLDCAECGLIILAIALTFLTSYSRKQRKVQRAIVLSVLAGIVWTMFWANALYFCGGWKPTLFMVLASLIQIAILLMVGRRVYRKVSEGPS